MKLVHVLMLLTFTITVVHSFVIRGIRDIGLHAIVPEIQIIKELYQQLQRHARQELSHMDIEPEMTMTTVSK